LPFGLTLATGVVLAFPTQIEEFFLEPVRTSQEYSDALSLGVDLQHARRTRCRTDALQKKALG
jgi:hypothetical protein